MQHSEGVLPGTREAVGSIPSARHQNKQTKIRISQMWWHSLVIPALQRHRQEDCCGLKVSLGHNSELETRLRYIVKPCLKRNK